MKGILQRCVYLVPLDLKSIWNRIPPSHSDLIRVLVVCGELHGRGGLWIVDREMWSLCEVDLLRDFTDSAERHRIHILNDVNRAEVCVFMNAAANTW